MHHILPKSLRNGHHEDQNNDASPPQQNYSETKNENPSTVKRRESEKHAIAHWEDQKRPLSPSQITIDPSKKPVGHSNKHLRCQDFELLKTLGTGTAVTPTHHMFQKDH